MTEILRRPTFVLLVVVVWAAIWLDAGAGAAVQPLLFAGAALLILLTGLTVLDQHRLVVLPWLGLVLVAGVFLTLLQLAPVWSLGAGEGPRIAPAAVKLRADLEQRAPESRTFATAASSGDRQLTELSDRAALSVDLGATRRALATLLAGLAIFVSAAWLIETPDALRSFLWPVALCGAALTLFAALVKATWSGALYWGWLESTHQGVFGPLGDHRTAGVILLLTSLAAVVWVLRIAGDHRVATGHSRGRGVTRGLRTHFSWGFSRGVSRIPLGELAETARRRWGRPREATALVVLLLNLIGLMATLSYGALVAFVAALAITLVIVPPQRGWTGLGLPVVVGSVGTAVAVAWYFVGELLERHVGLLLATPRQQGDTSMVSAGRDALAAAADYGVFGTGAGASDHVLRMYRESPEASGSHSLSQFLRVWIEWGTPGLLLIAAALAAVAVTAVTLRRRRRSSLRSIAFLGCLVVIAMAVQAAWVDRLLMPGVAFLVAALLGGVCGSAWRASVQRVNDPLVGAPGQAFLRDLGRPGGEPAGKGVWIGWSSGVAGVVLVTALLCIATVWATSAAIRWQRDAIALRPGSPPPQPTAEEIQRAIAALEPRVRGSDDGRIPLYLAQWHLADYAQQAPSGASQAAATELVEAPPAVDLDRLFHDQPTAAVARLLAHAWRLQDAGTASALETVIHDDPQVQPTLGTAHRLLQVARRLSPLLPEVHLHLGELEFLESQPRWDGRHVRRAMRLAPGDAEVQYRAGTLLIATGRLEEGLDAWQRSLQRSPRHAARIFAQAAAQDADAGAASDPWLEALLPQSQEAAIAALQQAVVEVPEVAELRAALAERLLQAGQIDGAMFEALEATRLQPQNPDFQELVRRIEASWEPSPEPSGS